MAPFTVALLGAVEVKVMVWDPWPTMITWVFCGAGFQLMLPAWLASRGRYHPGEADDPSGDAQTDVEVPSTVMTTGSPEVAVAVGV